MGSNRSLKIVTAEDGLQEIQPGTNVVLQFPVFLDPDTSRAGQLRMHGDFIITAHWSGKTLIFPRKS